MSRRYALTLACACLLGCAAPYAAMASTPDSYKTESLEAQALLSKAVSTYRSQGDGMLAQLSRQGEFTTANAYVYVINTKGVMLASGGPSALYIGRNIKPMLGAEMNAALDDALASPEDNAIHSREYRWENLRDGKLERKRVYFQRVGDKFFAAGYYMPRSSPQEAEKLLEDAIGALAKDADATLTRINRLDAFFNRDDLYVFVIDEHSGNFIAHGSNHRLVGTSLKSLKDANGQAIGPRIQSALAAKATGETNYTWRNPVTGAKELKHTLLKRQGQYIVAVGYFSPSTEP